MIRTTTAIAFIALGLAAMPAGALTLKTSVTAGGDVVRLGDIFTGGGEQSSVALFHAPEPGSRGSVNISRLRRAVGQLGISWSPPAGLERIMVTRPQTVQTAQTGSIPLAEIEDQLRTALAKTLPGTSDAEDIAVTVATRQGRIPLLGAGHHEIEIARLDIDPRRETFQAEIEVTRQDRRARHMLSGSYETYVRVYVLAVDIARGEIIGPEHLKARRTRRVDASAALTRDEVVGMSARRRLRAGTSPRPTDIEPPKLVTRNELVTITFQMPGITLTTQGRVLEDGARGEVISVRNINSNRVIQAVADSHGRVSVSTAQPSQLAMR